MVDAILSPTDRPSLLEGRDRAIVDVVCNAAAMTVENDRLRPPAGNPGRSSRASPPRRRRRPGGRCGG